MGVCANVAATSGRRSVQFCTTLHILKCGGQIRQYNFAQFILIARASPDHHLLELCKGDLTGSVEVGLPEDIFSNIRQSEISLTWERSWPQCRAFRHQDFCKRSRPSQLLHPPPSWDFIIFFIAWSSEPFPDRGHSFVDGWQDLMSDYG